jgi:ABC-type multidrug transport system fused ATPase/permease subunit
MKEFLHYFFGVLDETDKKRFKRYLGVIFIGGLFSIIGIGAVIPFINLLIQPEKVMSYRIFSQFSYNNLILLLTALLIVAYGLKNVMALWVVKYQANYLSGIVQKIRNRLFSGYMAMDYPYHVNRSTPHLIKVLQTESLIYSDLIAAPFGIFLIELISSCFMLAVLLFLSPLFTLSVLTFLSISIFIFYKAIKKKLKIISEMRTQAWTNLTSGILTGLSAIKETKLYHREQYFVNNFQFSAAELKYAAIYQQIFENSPRLLIEFSGLTVVLLVLCAYVLLGWGGQNLFVLLGVIGIAAAQLLPSMNRITQTFVQMKYGLPALKTIYEELNQVDTHNRSNLNSQPKAMNIIPFNSTVKSKNLCFSYSKTHPALENINITLKKNTKIAIVGSSGAGKTTFINVLMGLFAHHSGEIWVDDKQITSESDKYAFQKLFGYIPQSIILHDKTIKENIAFALPKEEINLERVQECLQLAKLDEFVSSLDKAENTIVGEDGIKLSGGQRQRIGIARALYHSPQILVMDEATSALDNKTESEVSKVISDLPNITIITIAHRLTTIKNYDEILLFEAGKIIAQGSYNNLLYNSAKFKNMANTHETAKSFA